MPAGKRVKRAATTSRGTSSLDIQPLANIPWLDYWTREKLQVQIQEVRQDSILPTTVLQEGAEIIFNIRGDPAHFIDPNSIRLQITAELRNGDSSEVAADANCAPISNLAGSLFSQVSVVVGNSTPVTSSNNLYPFLHYHENVIKSSQQYKDQYDFVSFIWRDKYGAFDQASDMNPAYMTRRTQAAGSLPIEMLVHIQSPITTQKRLIIPNIDLSFSLQPSPAKFLVRSDVLPVASRNQKIVITHIALLYDKLRLNTEYHLLIMQSIVKAPCLYPVKFQKTYEFTKQAGVSMIRETIFTDRLLPQTIFVYCVSSQRRSGTYATTPWLVSIENMSEIKFVSGSDTFPTIPFKPDIRKKNEMYISTKKCLGCFEAGMDNGLLINDFMGGYSILGFDLSRSGHPNFNDVPRIGDLQLCVDYRDNGLPQDTSFILIMDFFRNIYMRSNLEVTTEFVP